MLMKKKVSLGGDFAKVGEDLVDKTLIKILDEGKEVVGEFGPRVVFKIKTKNGDKITSFNQTSINNLVDAYGADSSSWVGQMVKVYVIKALVSGKMRDVVYYSAPDWDMLNDGSFGKSNKRIPDNSPVRDDEINVDEIGF